MLGIFRRREPDLRREKLLAHVEERLTNARIRSFNGAWTDGTGSIGHTGDDATFILDTPYLRVLSLELRLSRSEAVRLDDIIQDRILAELTHRRDTSTKGA